jgi:N-dimethylarginine dimethylaminohydrolase
MNVNEANLFGESERTAQPVVIGQLNDLRSVESDDYARIAPNAILMCHPSGFRVIDVKNQFMEGNIDNTSSEIALGQWEGVREAFLAAGYPVYVVPGAPDREDMVFAANQVLLSHTREKQPYALLSKMRHRSRQLEVPYFARWFADHNYQILELPGSDFFEGTGDALWHPERHLLWGGYGHRTEEAAYEQISSVLRVPIIKLRLCHPRFYHLDTAFCPLNAESVMYYPDAFDQAGRALINRLFKTVIEVTEHDAENFACNALPLRDSIIIQRGSADANAKLKAIGFNVVEVETGEFMKAGGSVSCMKLMIYDSAERPLR